MTEAGSRLDHRFDAVHPGGVVLARSCRGGYLHSVVLGESAMDLDADALAEAILMTAGVSHLKAALQVRQEIIDAGMTPSEQMASPTDLEDAQRQLAARGSR